MQRENESTDHRSSRRYYLSAVAASGISLLAGCSSVMSPKVEVALVNNDTVTHTIAIVVGRKVGNPEFERELSIQPDTERRFEEALPNPSEAEQLTAEATIDGETKTHEFQVGGASGTTALLINIKRGGEFVLFVSQS